MRKIETIWNELESGAASTDRILVRRYSAGVTPNIFVGLKVQSGLKCLAIRVENQILDDLEFENTLRDIRLETEPNEQDKSKSYLLLTLTDDDLITVFAVLCEDLIEAFKDESAEDKLVSNLIDRVGRKSVV